MDSFLQDIRFAVRSLLKSPGLMTAAVLCLAIGIGATTTVFSATDALVIHPVPTSDSDGLVFIAEVPPGPPDEDFDGISPANLLDWRSQSRSLARIAAYEWWEASVTGVAEPEHVQGFRVTPDFLDVLGVRPMIGRGFTVEDGEAGREASVILSHPLWQRRFGSDSGVIGRSVLLNGAPHTVIGVMAATFIFPPGAELWAPLVFTPRAAADRERRQLNAIARLRDGATIAEARAELSTIANRLAAQHPETNESWGARVEPIDTFFARHPRPYLLVMLASVGFVLLIACANVANLLLARATGRSREVAVRTALGASRWRIMRQMLTESMLLALVGGGAGALLALWGVLLMRGALPAELVKFNPGWTSIAVDGRALIFTTLAAVGTGLIFGIVPAVQASRPNLQGVLKEGGRGTSAGGARHRMRSALVVAEVALALVLLVGTGLMVRSYASLVTGDMGFIAERTLTMNLTLPRPEYADPAKVNRFYDGLLERVTAIPSVRSAALTNVLPGAWNDQSRGVAIEGRPAPKAGELLPSVRSRIVSAGYFEALRIGLVEGRTFSTSDDSTAPRVAVVSEAMARRFWPSASALGKRLTVSDDSVMVEIVGVVRDVRHNPNTGQPQLSPVLYRPLPQRTWRGVSLAVQTSAEPTSIAAAVQREIGRLDPALAAGEVLTLERVVAGSVAPQRITAGMLAIFAAVALLLAIVGIYGVISYSVTQRTHEIGVRVALGAQRGDVVRHVLRDALTLVALGVAIGLAGALAMTRGLASLLHGTSPTDPVTFVIVPLVLGATALLGSYLPARKAATVDPVVALRYEG